MDHAQDQDSLYPFHFQGNGPNSNSNSNNTGQASGGGNSNGHPHPSPHPGSSLSYHHAPAPHAHHDFQQELLSPTVQQHQQQFNAQHHLHSSQQSANSSYHGSPADLPKAIPHPVDMYQPTSQSQDHELINPLMNRHLNSHANSLQSPHHHQHHSYPQHHHSHQQQQHQHQHQPSPYYYQQQQQSKQYPDQYSDPTTPASTAASTLASGSTASTPSLSSPAPALPYQNNDYPYIGNNAALSHVHKNASPTVPFPVPTTPTTPTNGSHLASPTSAHHFSAGLPLAMPTWTTANASPSEQDMQPRQHQQPQSHLVSPPSHSHSHQPPYPQSARDLSHLGSLKGGDRSPYYQSPSQPPAHLYSPQGQDQHQQQSHHTPIWVDNIPSDSFHSPQEFLDQPDRQQHKQTRSFGAADNVGHPLHDPYPAGAGYMSGHSVPGHERSRVPPARHNPLTRNLVDYPDDHSNPHGQPSSLAAHQAGMASMDGLPLLPSSHLMHSDSQGQQFQPMLLNPAAGNKAMSTSLDPVPMGLGPPAIMSHPNYGAVASYMPAPSAPLSKSRSSASANRPPFQRTQSAGSQNAAPKHHRTRTSSVNSSSSVASSGIVSSLSFSLGAANISLSDSTSSITAASPSTSNIGTTVIGTGGTRSDAEDSMSKPRPGGHPRKAIAARVFECSFPGCNKAYTQLHNLKSHERTGHTPVQKPKPFLCIISGCTKAFPQRKSLALHIRASHKEYKFKPFKCSQPGCQKAYTQLHNLRTHEKTVHLLDLSRKRMRNPTPNSGGASAGGAGGGDSSCGSAGPQYAQGTYQSSLARNSSNMIDRNQFTPNVELSYESVDDLTDFNVRMKGEEEDEEEDEEELDDENGEDYADE